MDTTNAGSFQEREALIPIRDEARRRLNRARQGVAETDHLPKGDEAKEAAIRELALAMAVAAEMGVEL